MSASIENSQYLDQLTANKDRSEELVLLPHESYAVHLAMEAKTDEFKKITEAKIAVSGGDDWHDGAFRTTDTLAQVLTQSAASLQPYQAAITVEYPKADEPRVSLGSRVLISQNGVVFPVDVVGFRLGYPDNIIDEQTQQEVMATSPESPLGAAILGHVAGEQVHYQVNRRDQEAAIQTVNQVAIREFFMRAADVELTLTEEPTQE